jgi:hypothetical protein
MVNGTQKDDDGVVHIGTSMMMRPTSRWETRYACGRRSRDCVDDSGVDVITCVRCIGAKTASSVIRGQTADLVWIDEAASFAAQELADIIDAQILADVERAISAGQCTQRHPSDRSDA